MNSADDNTVGFDAVINLLLLGDRGVGKTAIRSFLEDSGISLSIKGCNPKVNIIRHRESEELPEGPIDAAFVVYDARAESSFKQLSHWLNQLETLHTLRGSKIYSVVVVANDSSTGSAAQSGFRKVRDLSVKGG